MKRISILIALIAINLTIFGQLKVGTNNYIGIGSFSEAPESFVSVGDAGSATSFFSIKSSFTTDHSRGLYVLQNSSPYHRYGIMGITYSGSGYAYGIYAQSYQSTASSGGRSYGLYAISGNSTSGWNYGVFGRLAGSNNGAGVFGTVSGDKYVDGKYAGYFYGNVKITGNAYINGSTLVTSDINAKKNIKGLPKGNLKKLDKLSGISYNLKTPSELNLKTAVRDTATVSTMTETEKLIYSKERIGLSAQEVQKVFPELVEVDNSGLLAIDYIGLIPVLIEAIKEQQGEIQELKSQNALLEKSVKDLLKDAGNKVEN